MGFALGIHCSEKDEINRAFSIQKFARVKKGIFFYRIRLGRLKQEAL